MKLDFSFFFQEADNLHIFQGRKYKNYCDKDLFLKSHELFSAHPGGVTVYFRDISRALGFTADAEASTSGQTSSSRKKMIYVL